MLTSQYKVLVLDKYAKALINNVIPDGDIVQRDVSSIELVDERRNDQNYLEAVYIVKPTAYNIECIAADYTKVPTRYAGANIFFTAGLDANLERKVHNSSIARYLRRMEQIFIDFTPLEHHTFTLGNNNTLPCFYNDQCMDLVNSELRKTALQLVSVCTTLDEYPIIRFYEADNTNRPSRKLPFMLAKIFQEELDNYARTHTNFPDPSEGRPRSVFLILDRSIDWCSPLLHEFTYQAAAYDLLPIKNWLEYAYTENGEDKVGKVSERDPEWVSLRHTHIASAGGILRAKLDKLKKDYPHLADRTKEANVNDLKDMIAGMPEFLETRSRYVFHVNMAGDIMEQISKKNLVELADIEQTCATGVDEDNSKAKGVADSVVAMLADDRLGTKEKVRLIALYAIHRGGLVDADYTKLMYHCGLKQEDLAVIRNYERLGAPVLKASPRDRVAKKDLPTRFESHISSNDVGNNDQIQSRFRPAVYNVVQSLAQGTLPSTIFPYIKDQPTEDDDAATDFANGSLRNQRAKPTWANSASKHVVKQRLFVFMAGGITASETRSCYELATLGGAASKEVLVGGSAFTAPNGFLDDLYRLTVPRAELGLEQDRPQPAQPPRFLFESDREVQAAKKAQAQQAQQRPGQGQGQPQAQGKVQPQGQAKPAATTAVPTKDKKGRFGKYFSSKK